MTVNQRALALAEDLSMLDQEMRFEALIEMGRALPSGLTFVDAERVRGCQSRVWLRVSLMDGMIYLEGDSDALIVKGLVAILKQVYEGAHIEEARTFDFVAWMKEAGIGLSMHRMQGLVEMVRRIQNAKNG